MEVRILKNIRIMGIAIVALSLIAIAVLISVAFSIALQGHLTCSAYESGCSIIGHFPPETFLGVGVLGIMTIIGLWMTIKSRREYNNIMHSGAAKNEAAKSLKGDEKTLYSFILNNEGTVFQNDMVKNLGYSKVKTSRILDRLEAKGLVERRRRGMANLIVLKK